MDKPKSCQQFTCHKILLAVQLKNCVTVIAYIKGPHNETIPLVIQIWYDKCLSLFGDLYRQNWFVYTIACPQASTVCTVHFLEDRFLVCRRKQSCNQAHTKFSFGSASSRQSKWITHIFCVMFLNSILFYKEMLVNIFVCIVIETTNYSIFHRLKCLSQSRGQHSAATGRWGHPTSVSNDSMFDTQNDLNCNSMFLYSRNAGDVSLVNSTDKTLTDGDSASFHHLHCVDREVGQYCATCKSSFLNFNVEFHGSRKGCANILKTNQHQCLHET